MTHCRACDLEGVGPHTCSSEDLAQERQRGTDSYVLGRAEERDRIRRLIDVKVQKVDIEPVSPGNSTYLSGMRTSLLSLKHDILIGTI